MQAFRRDELLPQWHISVARAFGIGLPLAAQLRRWHWNRPAAARTSRPSPGMAGICMHVHPGRGRAARPATSQFQRPLRGNPMPNAFHPRRRLTTLVITSPANGRRGGSKTPARRVLECFDGVNILDLYRHTLTYPTWGKQKITRPTHTGSIDYNRTGNSSEIATWTSLISENSKSESKETTLTPIRHKKGRSEGVCPRRFRC